MQIFPRKLNLLAPIAGAFSVVALAVVVFGVWYFLSPKNLVVGYAPTQPVPYSHRTHVGRFGMDCRYCHANVEKAAHAMVPPTQTCMGCHLELRKESARLALVRDSWKTGRSVPWVRVHRLPDHVYFDHSAHLAAGVGCVSCHGRIDEMDVVRVDQPLSMGWCLDCHRNPGPSLRPVAEITNMEWKQPAGFRPARAVAPPTYCTGCHR